MQQNRHCVTTLSLSGGPDKSRVKVGAPAEGYQALLDARVKLDESLEEIRNRRSEATRQLLENEGK